MASHLCHRLPHTTAEMETKKQGQMTYETCAKLCTCPFPCYLKWFHGQHEKVLDPKGKHNGWPKVNVSKMLNYGPILGCNPHQVTDFWKMFFDASRQLDHKHRCGVEDCSNSDHHYPKSGAFNHIRNPCHNGICQRCPHTPPYLSNPVRRSVGHVS